MLRSKWPTSAIVCLILLSALASALGAQRKKDATKSPDDLVREGIFRFQATFDSVWRKSSGASVRGVREPERSLALHCHTENKGSFFFSDNVDRFSTTIYTKFAACPTWPLGRIELPDERLSVDYALKARDRAPIHIKRDSLIGLLDRTFESTADRDLVLGQLVRFLSDQGEFERAHDAAQRCEATVWWCSALDAYTWSLRRDLKKADSLYTHALAAMPDSVRCDWNNMATALDLEGDKFYTAIPCGQRDSIDARVWWLSDPMFIEPGNERRVEHFARKTLVALRTALEHDERWEWRAKTGGDARARMIYRYGWPSFVYWGGIGEDAGHTGYLGTANEPYTTYEYTTNRIHTIPSHEAIRNPFAAVSGHWDMFDTNTTIKRTLRNAVWWPREHMEPLEPLTQLPDPQTAFLRRQDRALLAVSVDLPAASLKRVLTTQIPQVTLVVSPAPDSVIRVAERTGLVGAPNVLSGLVATTPGLAGVEFHSTGGGRFPGGRTRFGVTPPPPLSDMRTGEIAISDPVILQAGGSDETLPVETNAALNWMASSNRVQPVGRMGIYWETYGFAAADTMELAVWIERHTGQGIARSFTNRLGLTTDLNTPVAVNWTELPNTARVHVIEGPVRIVGRSVSVDVSHLPKGNYWLDVAAKTHSGETVRGRREFIVQ